MKPLNEKRESNAEHLWIWIFQVIGLLLFIAPLYLPVRAYFFTDVENVPLKMSDIGLAACGIFLARGGKAVGIVINNIGVIISDWLKRIANIK